MFSSQWFLTLFTAKFPLSLVYHVLDWFLMEGPNVIYRISLAMLRTWRRDLLALDFEGINSGINPVLNFKHRCTAFLPRALTTSISS